MIILSFECLPYFITDDFLSKIQKQLQKYQLNSQLFSFIPVVQENDDDERFGSLGKKDAGAMRFEDMALSIHDRLTSVNSLSKTAFECVENRTAIDVAISTTPWLLETPEDPLLRECLENIEASLADTLSLCGSNTTHVLIYLQQAPRDCWKKVLAEKKHAEVTFSDVLNLRTHIEQKIQKWNPVTHCARHTLQIPLHAAENPAMMRVLAQEIATITKHHHQLAQQAPIPIDQSTSE